MIVVGLDVGNSTTEAVLVDASTRPPTVLAVDRAPTRGSKGSPSSLRGAAVLVARLRRRVERPVDLVVVAPLRPVTTSTVRVSGSPPGTGRLDVVPTGGDTPGSNGVGVGEPVWAGSPPHGGGRPVVLLVAPGTGYRTAVQAFRDWTVGGNDVAGVLVGDDEGVLVASRIAADVPVADLVDVHRVSSADLVAVEVRPPGHPLTTLGDPVRLAFLLQLTDAERADAAAAAGTLGDASRGVVARHAQGGTTAPSTPVASVWLGDRTEQLSHELVASLPVGAVQRWLPPLAGDATATPVDVDDLWTVSLREVASSVGAAVGAATARGLVVAALRSGTAACDPTRTLEELLGVEVRLVRTEASAARAGALSTPGAQPGCVVVDIGGGTIDVIDEHGAEVVAAGAGELLTAAVAGYLGVPLGAADWVKRGPSSRVEAPQVLLSEDGTRSFLDHPVVGPAVGMLAVEGPAGLLPFEAVLSPSAWRALRRRLKERVVADNVVRALTTAGAYGQEVLLVGGAAGDDELLGLLRSTAPGVLVGRADVASGLGHRCAVGFGLTVLGTADEAVP